MRTNVQNRDDQGCFYKGTEFKKKLVSWLMSSSLPDDYVIFINELVSVLMAFKPNQIII